MTKPYITNCPKCGKCYEEFSEEHANSPSRECLECYRSERIFGKTWEEIQALQQGRRIGKPINLNAPGDYGADPIGDGTFRMVPSGDVVDYAERCRRLKQR